LMPPPIAIFTLAIIWLSGIGFFAFTMKESAEESGSASRQRHRLYRAQYTLMLFQLTGARLEIWINPANFFLVLLLDTGAGTLLPQSNSVRSVTGIIARSVRA
jgi:hypothetical protein